MGDSSTPQSDNTGRTPQQQEGGGQKANPGQQNRQNDPAGGQPGGADVKTSVGNDQGGGERADSGIDTGGAE